MTWLKLDDEFDDDCANADLSESACWTHVQGLLYVMRHNTGGRITDKQFKRFAHTDDRHAAARELVDAGFWARTETGFVVVHQMDLQPTPEQVAARKKADAARQQKARDKKASEALAKAEAYTADLPSRRDSRRDDTRDHGAGLVGADRGGTGSQALEVEGLEIVDIDGKGWTVAVPKQNNGTYSR